MRAPFVSLLVLWVRRSSRNVGGRSTLLARILFFSLVALPVLITIIATATMIDPVIRQFYSGSDPVSVVNAAIGPSLLVILVGASLLKAQPQIPLFSFLLTPVSKRRLILWYHVISVFNIVNCGLVLFVASYCAASIAGRYNITACIAWLFTMAGMILFVQLSANLLRDVRRRSLSLFVFAIIVILLVALVNLYPPISLVARASVALFGNILNGDLRLVAIPFVALVLLYPAAAGLTKRAFYVDEHSESRRGYGQSSPGIVAGKRPFVLDYLQLLLMQRNRRLRFGLFGPVLLALFAILQLATGLRAGSTWSLLVGILPLILAAGLPYTLHSLRTQSTYFDGLFVWPLSAWDISRSISRLSAGASSVAFLIVLPVVVFIDSKAIPLLGSVYLYSLGIANPILVWAATFETARFDPTLSTFSTKGAVVSNPFRNLAAVVVVIMPPLAVLTLASNPLDATSYVPLACLGLAGLLLTRLWLEAARHTIERRKYRMLAGFRLTH